MATVKGKWLFNEVLDAYGTAFEQSVEFTASFVDESTTYDGRFTGIKYKPTESNLVAYTVGSTVPASSYWESGEDTVVYLRAPNYNTDAWSFEGINEVDFGSTEQTVSDEFMTWLTANAVPLDAEETTAATITHNGEVIASLNAGQTATLKCAGMKMATDVVVAVAENIGGGECDKPHIIEVDTLPTENIDENAVYLCGGAYYTHGTKLADVLVLMVSLAEVIGGAAITYHYATTKPTENIAVTGKVYNIYYIADENNLFLYGNFAGNGENVWVTGSEAFNQEYGFNPPFAGVVSDASEVTSYDLWAVVQTGWTKYLTPAGTLTITENGTHDVSEYASVNVGIPKSYIVQTVAELPSDAGQGSMAIVIGGE